MFFFIILLYIKHKFVLGIATRHIHLCFSINEASYRKKTTKDKSCFRSEIGVPLNILAESCIRHILLSYLPTNNGFPHLSSPCNHLILMYTFFLFSDLYMDFQQQSASQLSNIGFISRLSERWGYNVVYIQFGTTYHIQQELLPQLHQVVC